MGDLKPLGSEKLQGQEKINRIIELSRFKENTPGKINETSKSEYNINLVDGNQYQIVREKLGYIIKKTISESETDYIEPMKNRRYHSSYAQALKRLNLLTKEVNRLNENEEGTSLFGEQKKFVLKTPAPKPSEEPALADPAPATPPPVPQPELPPSPDAEPIPGGEDDMENPEEGMDDMENPEEGMENPEDGMDEPSDDMGGSKGEEVVTFKSIQKLTGKLTQKIREFETEKGLTSENIKYVINMVISALDLSQLSDEDKEDILSKFDGEGEEDMGDEDFGSEEDMGSDEGMDMGDETSAPVGTEEQPEATESYGSIMDALFKESKVDRVISKYFNVSKEEKRKLQESKIKKELNKKSNLRKNINESAKFSVTIEQELAAQKFLQENRDFKFVGKTNLKNLVFEKNNKQIKVTPEGFII